MTNEQFASFRTREIGYSPLKDWVLDLGKLLEAAAESLEMKDTCERRQEVITALIGGLIEHVRRVPSHDAIDELDLVPLQHLLAALADLRLGHSNRLLEPARNTGRPGSSHRARRMRAHARAFVRLFNDAGLEMGKAEEQVARAYTRAGLRGHRSAYVSAGSVHSWRMSSSENGQREAQLATEYERLWRLQVVGSPTLAQVRTWLAKQAAELARVH